MKVYLEKTGLWESVGRLPDFGKTQRAQKNKALVLTEGFAMYGYSPCNCSDLGRKLPEKRVSSYLTFIPNIHAGLRLRQGGATGAMPELQSGGRVRV
ncbi:MAG: hypothetical protein Fur0022_26570 [Anaerolineales bacterium]